MVDQGASKGRGSSPALEPRRSSPRLPIRRLVIIACPHWRKYKEVYSKNVGRQSLMVLVPEDPPAAKSPIAVWIGSENLEKPRSWTKGHVVRLEDHAGTNGETGVVIQLIEPEAESIWCLIARGDEDKIPLPRSTPRFRRPQEEHKSPTEKPKSNAIPATVKPAIELDRRPTQEPPAELPAPEVPPPEVTPPELPPPQAAPDKPPIPEPLPLDLPSFELPMPELSSLEPTAPPSDVKEEPARGTHSVSASAEGESFFVPPLEELLDRPDTDVESPPPGALSASDSPLDASVYQVPPPDELLDRPDTEVEGAPDFKSTYRHTSLRGRRVIEETIVQLDDTRLSRARPTPVSSASDSSRMPHKSNAGGEQPPSKRSKPPPVPPLERPQPPPIPPPHPDPGGHELREGKTHPRDTSPPARQSAPPPKPSAPPPRQSQPAPRPTHPPLRQSHAPRKTESTMGQPAPSGGIQPMGGFPSQDRPRMSDGKQSTTRTAPMVGIDFGTTYSKVAIYDNSEIILIEDTKSTSSTRASVPSVVAFTPDGGHVVGERAQEYLAVDPKCVISSVKRAMGLTFSDPLANGILGSLSCGTSAGPNESILFEVRGQQYTVPDVASRILAHMRAIASEFVGADVREAVLTIPVDFDRRARRDLELASRMAGLDVKAFIPEPVSAAMGCGYDGTGRAFVAVYDFGGGTFDSSIVEVGQDRFMVRGSAGDRWLGGDDFDELMARYVADEFQKTTGISIHNRAEEWQRLLFACEEAKRWLSTLNSVDVVLPRAASTAEGPKTLLVPVARDVFEDLTRELVASTIEICRQSASQAGVHPKNVDSLLITGGSTRIPAIRDAAQNLFHKQAAFGVHPQHAVAIGAAVRAAVISGAPVPDDFAERLRGQGTVGRSIGIALAGGTTEHIIDSSQRAPVAAHRQYSTNRDGQTTIRIELVQGASHRTDENRKVGGFVVEGLPPKKAGVINLDVYFELSTTGTLHVTAQERSSGKRAQGTFDLDIV